MAGEHTFIAYFVTDNGRNVLCVLNPETREFHRFPLTFRGTARIASEAAAAVYVNVQREQCASPQT